MNRNMKNSLSAVVFLLPYGIFYAVFMLWPVFEGAYVSLFKWNLMGKVHFGGLANYINMFQDGSFWESLWHSGLFALISTPLYLVMGFLLALICNRTAKLKKFYRMAYFMPYVLSVSVISYIAVFIFQAQDGLVNQALHAVGIQGEPSWLSDPVLAWTVILLATLWWTVSFNMILYLAAMQDVPEELYEAADLDGAGQFRKIFSITIPMVCPTTWMLLQIVASFKLFGQPYMITGGGPGTVTRPIIQYIYESGFKNNNLGYASAMSYLLFIILIIIAIFQMRAAGKES